MRRLLPASSALSGAECNVRKRDAATIIGEDDDDDDEGEDNDDDDDDNDDDDVGADAAVLARLAGCVASVNASAAGGGDNADVESTTGAPLSSRRAANMAAGNRDATAVDGDRIA